MIRRIIIIEAKSDTKGFIWQYLPDDEIQLLPTKTWIVPAMQRLFDGLPDGLTEMVIRIKQV